MINFKYFTDIKTAEECKKRYKELCMKNHPDLGGDLETMKSINLEFEKAWVIYKDKHQNVNGEFYEQTEEPKKEKQTSKQFMDIISQIIHIPEITIEVIGSWIWIGGLTYPYKEILKEVGFTYSKTKKMWYHTGQQQKEREFKRRGRYTVDQLREKWGVEKVGTKQRNLIT